ncbi:MAG: hypothetical protein WAV93_11565 [Bacteroidales bacterium]
MALANVGGGLQFGDGNVNEVKLVARNQATVIAAAYTLTAADLASGIIYATSSGSYALTTPTGAGLDAILGNANVGASFELSLCHGSATNVITLTAGATGVTVYGLATVTGITSGTWVFRKVATATWAAYRI